jgi:hypothetical protein
MSKLVVPTVFLQQNLLRVEVLWVGGNSNLSLLFPEEKYPPRV